MTFEHLDTTALVVAFLTLLAFDAKRGTLASSEGGGFMRSLGLRLGGVCLAAAALYVVG